MICYMWWVGRKKDKVKGVSWGEEKKNFRQVCEVRFYFRAVFLTVQEVWCSGAAGLPVFLLIMFMGFHISTSSKGVLKPLVIIYAGLWLALVLFLVS